MRVGLKELPDYEAGIEVVGSLADDRYRQILQAAGPGVAAADDGVADGKGLGRPAVCGEHMGKVAATEATAANRSGWVHAMRCAMKPPLEMPAAPIADRSMA